MIIALTGLHRAGKSFFCKSGIAEKYGFKVYDKKQIVTGLCLKELEKNGQKIEDYVTDEMVKQNSEAVWDFCNAWYGEKMKEDPIAITRLIVDYAIADVQACGIKNIILDAVHNNLEWEIIKDYQQDSALLLFNTEKEVRDQRASNIELITKKNVRRVSFWSKDQSLLSLPCMASWFIDGAGNLEEIETSFKYFVEYLENGEVEPVKEEEIEIVDAKDLILKNLIAENNALTESNRNLEKIIQDLRENGSCLTVVPKGDCGNSTENSDENDVELE